ncbi:PaaI family thioesterase [Dysgonomonas sp. 511]|uniref:PaaI family thioesterase n=1 Tax=Dysgonomonas sp. 511 TaxID=2302930 RepID=UPI0013D7AF25|nr:PaaI family thioesterase [Dysgonomonas sp. 511]NDV78879.1 PaaI family thioesterase [Dysgonomonas sp. 511]
MSGIGKFFENDQFAKSAGVELLEAGVGYAKARMKITPLHLNAGGVCQGGAIFTLADFAFAVATNSHGKLTLSVSSNINFFKSEKEGFLYAEAKEAFNHKKLSNCEVQVTNEDGELVATFNGNGYRKECELPFETSGE